MADSHRDLDSLLAIFRALARGTMKEIELCAATKAYTRNLRSLVLRVDELQRDRRKRLTRASSYSRRLSAHPEPPSFIWAERQSGWLHQSSLIESLIGRNCASNHDLTEEGVDGVLVELSFQGAA